MQVRKETDSRRRILPQFLHNQGWQWGRSEESIQDDAKIIYHCEERYTQQLSHLNATILIWNTQRLFTESFKSKEGSEQVMVALYSLGLQMQSVRKGWRMGK